MEEKSVNKTNSNGYTFMFAIILVVVVAALLAFAATSLQPIQQKNVRQEKKQNILATVGVDSVEVDGQKVPLTRDLADEFFDKYITESVALKEDGSVDDSVDAFEVDLAKELKNQYQTRSILYILLILREANIISCL